MASQIGVYHEHHAHHSPLVFLLLEISSSSLDPEKAPCAALEVPNITSQYTRNTPTVIADTVDCVAPTVTPGSRALYCVTRLARQVPFRLQCQHANTFINN